MAPKRPKMVPRRPQDWPRRPQERPKRASGRHKMAQERPTKYPRELQKEPQECPKRDIGPNLAQRPFQESPGTLPNLSGELPGPSWTSPGSDFATNLESQNGPSEGKAVRFETYMPNCTTRLKHTIIYIYTAALAAGGLVGAREAFRSRKRAHVKKRCTHTFAYVHLHV